jgi:hypothetical protein
MDISGSMFRDKRYDQTLECTQKVVKVLHKYADINIVMFDMLEQRITAKELLQMKNSKDSPV